MGDTERRDWTFACPTCGESLAVDDAVKSTLLRHGCVVCLAGLTDEAFSRPSGGPVA